MHNLCQLRKIVHYAVTCINNWHARLCSLWLLSKCKASRFQSALKWLSYYHALRFHSTYVIDYVLNRHQTSSSSIIRHAIYSTCPFISYLGHWYQSKIIAGETSSSTIDDCITLIMSVSVIVGYNNIDFVLSLVKIAKNNSKVRTKEKTS